jgi:hypothetical protein
VLTFTAGVPLLRRLFVFRMDAIPNLNDAAIRDFVYAQIITANHATKETAAGRLRDLDEATISCMSKDGLNVIHDIAVSSGVTSLELLGTLQSRGLPVSLHISDKYAKYATTGRILVRILDADGALVEMYVCGILARSNLSMKFCLSRLLYSLLGGKSGNHKLKWFLLFDAKVIEHIEAGVIDFIDYDAFETREAPRFTFVRCMNLLNLNYFSSDKIVSALRNIIGSLKEGGILQIGRTRPDGHNAVGFYIKTGGGLKLVTEVGGGTELRDVIRKFLD